MKKNIPTIVFIVGVFLIFIFGFLTATWSSVYYYNHEVYPTEKVRAGMFGDWACMDGCYNMQELIYNWSEGNETMKLLHQQCADECFEQYMSNVSCVNG